MLAALLEDAGVVAAHGDTALEVGGVAYDSRRVRAGDAFFALAGLHADGARFVDAAFAAGAVAAVVPRGFAAAGRTTVEVEEPRRAMALAAARLHGEPSRALSVVGVTGTNGKTTTTYLLESVLHAAGRVPGVIGTTGVKFGERTRASAFTTPESPELQSLLAEMRDAGVGSVAMEVSSHALVQRRTYGVAFDVVAFTNLTQDHLDYHGTMDAYLDAKLMLFDGRNGGVGKRAWAVVNADDPAADRVAAAAERGGFEVRRVSAGGAALRGAALVIERVTPRPGGLELVARAGGEARAPFVLPLLGRYNASNAAVAYGAALALGIVPGTIESGLAAVAGVPGRLERVVAGQPFTVAVDYAHTPDALERTIAAARDHAPGRVLLVFGCGGDRDRGKRPLMGAIAARACERAWITNDNPRSEEPAAIAREISAGDPEGRLATILDRREAIAAAIAEARPGDLVLVAGKGHETTQTIGATVAPFDDRTVAREALAARGWAGR